MCAFVYVLYVRVCVCALCACVVNVCSYVVNVCRCEWVLSCMCWCVLSWYRRVGVYACVGA